MAASSPSAGACTPLLCGFGETEECEELRQVVACVGAGIMAGCGRACMGWGGR
jgi:hypothetical protein